MIRSQAVSFTERVKYRKAFLSFVDLERFSRPFAVTLTLKQSVIVDHGIFPVHVRIDQEKAVQNFRHFMNLMNRRVYGRSFQRHGKRIQVIPILEGGGSTRLHYHCVIDCPAPHLEAEYDQMIRQNWSKTKYGYDEIDIQRDPNFGWVQYISKFRGKSEYDQSIDWTNFHQN